MSSPVAITPVEIRSVRHNASWSRTVGGGVAGLESHGGSRWFSVVNQLKFRKYRGSLGNLKMSLPKALCQTGCSKQV